MVVKRDAIKKSISLLRADHISILMNVPTLGETEVAAHYSMLPFEWLYLSYERFTE